MNATRTGLRAVSVTLAVALGLGLSPLAAVADDETTVPSEQDVSAAQAAVTGQATTVAGLDAQIASANAELTRVGRAAETASSRYNGAKYLLAQKEAEEKRLAADAATARGKAATARSEAGRQAAVQYRTGGSLGTLHALFGGEGPQSLVDRAGGVSLVSKLRGRELRSSVESSSAASSLESAAQRATAQRKVAATNAANAKTAAEKAYTTALTESQRLGKEKEAAILRLASLRKVSVETERKRQDGLEAQRLAAAAQARREARERAEAEAKARAAEQAQSPTGANTATGYPLPVTVTTSDAPAPEVTLPAPSAPASTSVWTPPPATTPAETTPRYTAPAPSTTYTPPAPSTTYTPPAPSTTYTPPAPTTTYTPPPPAPTTPPPPPAGTGYNAAASQTAIDYAMARLGYPYLWGATGPTYYDCSGLVAMAWRSAGVYMPNWNEGIYSMDFAHIPVAQAKPGDILLFGSGPDDIWHSGIYLGGGKMINATHPGSGISIYPVEWAGEPMPYAVRPAT